MDWTIEFDKAIEQYLPDLEVLQDEPMSRHTTFRIGGPAKRMAFPSSREQLVLLMSFAKDYGEYSWAMWFLITVPPAIGMVLAILPTLKYEITKEQHQKMLSELIERHKKEKKH